MSIESLLVSSDSSVLVGIVPLVMAGFVEAVEGFEIVDVFGLSASQSMKR